MDIRIIKELTQLVKTSGLSALEIDENGTRIRLENSGGPVFAPAAGMPLYTPDVPEVLGAEKTLTAEEKTLNVVKSPMVGVFCLPEKAGKKALSSGDRIEIGTVVCAIEAMKMMVEIESEFSGVFVEFLCADGDQVEFGQPLLKIAP